MNIFARTIPTRIFVAVVGLSWLVIPYPAVAQDDTPALSEQIPVLGDEPDEAKLIMETNWLQEAMWAMQWIYLPRSLERVDALYGYSFSDIENCSSKEICTVEISEPVIVYHQGDDDTSSTLKLDWDIPDTSKDKKFELRTIIITTRNIITSQRELQKDHWYLATGTFIPGVDPSLSYVINKP